MHGTRPDEMVQTLVIVAVVALIIARRIRGRKVWGPRQAIVVAVLVLYGGALVLSAAHTARPGRLTGPDLTVLTVSALVSLVLGAVRGATVAYDEREGTLYSRYVPLTVVLWFVTLAIRIGIDAGASRVGASGTVAGAGLLMMFGISLAGETIVVKARAAGYRTGSMPAPRR